MMTHDRGRPAIQFEGLPFHIGTAEEPSNGGFPEVLPFAAGIRADLGLLVQLPDQHVIAELDRVYRRGSMLGTPLSAEGLGREYADDFLDFILRTLPAGTSGRSVLEIGCGSGYLLGRLSQMGADVLGIEPGPQGAAGVSEHGVSIIRTSFDGPGQLGGRRFDLILHHCVLEHVPDPVGFLRSQRELLEPGGRLIVGVPDEEPYIRHGDISTLAHQHWSYFTKTSLHAALCAAGFAPVTIAPAGFGGATFAVAEVGDATETDHDWSMVSGFPEAARATLAKLSDFLSQSRARTRTVGMWPGARAFNYLYLLAPDAPVRLFDDDPRVAGKYYPPIAVPVETRAQLIERPVDELLILTRAFGTTLREQLRSNPALFGTTIRLLDELGEG